MIDLHGRRALVTGGSRGIGAATARLLARAGADVVIGYRSRARDAQRVVDDIVAVELARPPWRRTSERARGRTR
jgi:Short-chain dehydrogenases of various substrate specificities